MPWNPRQKCLSSQLRAFTTILLTICLLVTQGCPGDEEDGTQDAGPGDQGLVDSAGLPDAGSSDSAADQSVTDSAGSDVGSADVGSADSAPSPDAYTGPTVALFGQVFGDPADCPLLNVKVHEYNNPSNSTLTTNKNGYYKLTIPANMDVVVRVDGPSSATGCLSTLRKFNLPAGNSQQNLNIISTSDLAAAYPFTYNPSQALFQINFKLSYGTAAGTETGQLTTPSATPWRFNGTAWVQSSTTLKAGITYNHWIVYPAVNPAGGMATFSVGPSTGTPSCVEPMGTTTVPLAPYTMSYVDVKCTN